MKIRPLFPLFFTLVGLFLFSSCASSQQTNTSTIDHKKWVQKEYPQTYDGIQKWVERFVNVYPYRDSSNLLEKQSKAYYSIVQKWKTEEDEKAINIIKSAYYRWSYSPDKDFFNNDDPIDYIMIWEEYLQKK